MKPSDIRFSQDSIANRFGEYSDHPDRLLGETLDDLLLRRCTPHDIPYIRVSERNGKWYTADNRRLWVFQKAEELGAINDIPVKLGFIKPQKFTTTNDGVSIDVRGKPGGNAWRTWKNKKQVGNKDRHFTTSNAQKIAINRNNDCYGFHFNDEGYNRNEATRTGGNFSTRISAINQPTPRLFQHQKPFVSATNSKYEFHGFEFSNNGGNYGSEANRNGASFSTNTPRNNQCTPRDVHVPILNDSSRAVQLNQKYKTRTNNNVPRNDVPTTTPKKHSSYNTRVIEDRYACCCIL